MLNKPFNNAKACITWLSYLDSQCGAGSVIGKLNDKVIETAAVYEAQRTSVTYGAEANLKGEPGIDLSVEYFANNFLDGNPLVHTLTKEQGERFHGYVKELKALAPHVIGHCCLYLETDTASGNPEETSCFVNLAGELVEKLLPAQLERNGAGSLTATIMELLAKCKAYTGLWIVGFMNSRECTPVRLSLLCNNDSVEDIVATVKLLYGEATPADFSEKVRALGRLGCFQYMLDLDVLPDGTLGDTIGFEFAMRKLQPALQSVLCKEAEYKDMVKLLKQWDVADDRIDVLPQCIWAGKAPDEQQEPYYMYSRISHFKLRWRGNVMLPAKVYLQLVSEPIQESLNIYFDL